MKVLGLCEGVQCMCCNYTDSIFQLNFYLILTVTIRKEYIKYSKLSLLSYGVYRNLGKRCKTTKFIENLCILAIIFVTRDCTKQIASELSSSKPDCYLNLVG